MRGNVTTAALAGLATAAGVSGAFAQDDTDPYYAYRNQIGLLRYCVARGFVDVGQADTASGHLQEAIATLPAPSDPARGDASEKAGASGKWGHTETDLADYVKIFGTTEEAQCKEWVR